MSTSRSPRTPASPATPDETTSERVLKALDEPEALISAVCWRGTTALVIRVVWPGEHPDWLARALDHAVDRYGEPAGVLAVMPPYEISTAGFAPGAG